MHHLTKYSFLMLVLSGCASTSNVDILQEGPRVNEVYAKGTNAVNGSDSPTNSNDRFTDAAKAFRSVPIYQPDIRGWSRDSQNEINGLFPKLPNPVITLYVYPHLASSEDLPVPGYATQMNLYGSDQFALPSELPQTHQDATYKKIVVNGVVREL